MCRCKPNWKGDTCAEDVDECEEDQTLCSDKNNTTCVNTHGWYQCDCIKGFKENADGHCVAGKYYWIKETLEHEISNAVFVWMFFLKK
jgi:hypothetical protein